MERAVEIYAVIHLGVIGLSHILAPTVWIDIFVRLRGWGHPGVFVSGALSLVFGAIVAAFYNVWSGSQLLLTLLGWVQVSKAALYFCFPALGMRGLRRVDPSKPQHLVISGIGLIAVCGVVIFGWF